MKSIAVKSLVTLLGLLVCAGLLWFLTSPTSMSALADAGSRSGNPQLTDPKTTPTPGCCSALNGSGTATCAVQPGGLRDFNYSITVNNPCPYPVNITHFIYLEVSTDGINFSFIARTSAENMVLQPDANCINGSWGGRGRARR